jgi:hypothetical protein
MLILGYLCTNNIVHFMIYQTAGCRSICGLGTNLCKTGVDVVTDAGEVLEANGIVALSAPSNVLCWVSLVPGLAVPRTTVPELSINHTELVNFIQAIISTGTISVGKRNKRTITDSCFVEGLKEKKLEPHFYYTDKIQIQYKNKLQNT